MDLYSEDISPAYYYLASGENSSNYDDNGTANISKEFASDTFTTVSLICIGKHKCQFLFEI